MLNLNKPWKILAFTVIYAFLSIGFAGVLASYSPAHADDRLIGAEKVAEIDCMRYTQKESPADYTVMPPNTTYEKWWEVENCGNTTWNNYVLERLGWCCGGETLSPSRNARVPALTPGEIGKIYVTMTTQTKPGPSRTYFMLAKPGPSAYKFGVFLWDDHTVR